MDIDDEPPLGPDGDLVVEMVQKAVVPLLTKHFEAGAYDPYSTPQTRKSIDLVEVVGDLTGKDSKKYTSLLKAILAVFGDHIVSLATLVGSAMAPGSIPPPAFTPDTRIALLRFIGKRVKLLKNILLWRREAPMEVRELVNRLVGEVIRPIMERQWEGGGKELGVLVSRLPSMQRLTAADRHHSRDRTSTRSRRVFARGPRAQTCMVDHV
jgi:GC-rich sequence DNA-binding factor